MRYARRTNISTTSQTKIPKDMLELASHIVETKSGHFEPDKFEDQYEDALKELLKRKQAGGEDRRT
jgi:non-homologous end joining protein Ku